MTDEFTPDSSGKPWTSDDDKALIRFINVKVTHAQIAELMGRTKASVSNRVNTLTTLKVEDTEKRSNQKREDTKFLIDVLRGIHPVTGNAIPEHSPWKGDEIVADIKKYLNEQEIIKRHHNQLPLESDEYVKIEDLEAVTFINEKWKTLEFDYKKARELNFLEGKLLNNRFPYTEEEFRLLEHMYSKRKNLNELERIFQRTYTSLINILKNRGIEVEIEEN